MWYSKGCTLYSEVLGAVRIPTHCLQPHLHCCRNIVHGGNSFKNIPVVSPSLQLDGFLWFAVSVKKTTFRVAASFASMCEIQTFDLSVPSEE